MKCLIVGNSHASMVQLALREGWSQAGLELDIIVIPERTQPEMPLAEGRICPAGNLAQMRSNVEAVRSNGPNTGALADGSHAFARACHGLHSPDLRVPQVSRQVMTEIVAHDIDSSGFLPLMRNLTEQGGPPLRVVPRPRPAARLMTTAAAELQALYGDQVENALGPYFALHDEVEASLAGKMARILWQSPQMMNGLFTAAPFTQPADFTHMNSAYGRAALDQLAASMQG